MFNKETRLKPKDVIDALVEGARTALGVVALLLVLGLLWVSL